MMERWSTLLARIAALGKESRSQSKRQYRAQSTRNLIIE